ncbi:hypothetical protein MMC14_002854 [Varicellaria rhodocarpa]|nr:hypothetical protein [Varicellaria rhodocarpa]
MPENPKNPHDLESAPGYGFTATIHKAPYEDTDPTKVSLPQPFVVLITGAGRGIGKDMAYSYAKAKASGIIICARNKAELDAVAKQIAIISPSTKCIPAVCDVSSEDAVKALVPTVEESFGRLDLLVNNAGILGSPGKKFGESSDFSRVVDVNLVAVLHTVYYFLPLLLRSDHGAKSIVNISSETSQRYDGPGPFCVSKIAVNRFTETLAHQYVAEGLLAYTIHPGAVLTEGAQDLARESALPPQLLARKFSFLSSRTFPCTNPLARSLELTDSPDLCGAFCVWLTKQPRKWLSGRYLCAAWDVKELEARKDEVVSGDLLKITLKV